MYIIEHDYACACCSESFGHGSQIRKVLIRSVHQYEEDRVRLPSEGVLDKSSSSLEMRLGLLLETAGTARQDFLEQSSQ